jgi:nitroreductase
MVMPAANTGPGTMSVARAAAQRRSIRAFDPEPIPQDDLDAIFEVTRLAPSAWNLQPWRFVSVHDPARKAQLAEAAYRQRQVSSAPVVIAIYTDMRETLADVDRVIHPASSVEVRERARKSIERAFAGQTEEQREAWGARQGYIALGYLLLAAAERGYDTSPMLGFDHARAKAALNVPPHAQVIALVAIGRGTEEGRPHHRLPLVDLVARI